MLYYDFMVTKDSRPVSDLKRRDNGTVVRKNRILLGHLKNPALLRYCRSMMIMPCYIYMIWLTYRKK